MALPRGGYTHTERLCGHEDMRQITDALGGVWCVNKRGTRAWPLFGEAYTPGTYDIDIARSQGHEVDVAIPASDQRVRGAGPGWLDIYDRLKAGEMTPVTV